MILFYIIGFALFLYLLIHFYPSDDLHSAAFATATCPSVHPSVTAAIVSKGLNLF